MDQPGSPLLRPSGANLIAAHPDSCMSTRCHGNGCDDGADVGVGAGVMVPDWLIR
jgi:hypothetical protein